MLARAVAYSLKVTVQARDLRNRLFRRFYSLEAQHVSEMATVHVLLAGRIRVKIEVTLKQSCPLQHARDIAGPRSYSSSNLSNIGYAAAVKLKYPYLL